MESVFVWEPKLWQKFSAELDPCSWRAKFGFGRSRGHSKIAKSALYRSFRERRLTVYAHVEW